MSMPSAANAALCMAGETVCSTGSPNMPTIFVFPVIFMSLTGCVVTGPSRAFSSWVWVPVEYPLCPLYVLLYLSFKRLFRREPLLVAEPLKERDTYVPAVDVFFKAQDVGLIASRPFAERRGRSDINER